VGSTITAADLKAYGFFNMFEDGLWDFIPADYLGPYPHIQAFLAQIRALPAIASYYAAATPAAAN
jgi:glutathione S-transferase